MSLARVRRELENRGLLLATDPVLPSVTRLVAGEPIRGSWWGHPKAHRIYAVLEALEDDPNVLFVKLVSRKVTLVHRSLWAELFAVAMARESWQRRGLSGEARKLERRVENDGRLRMSRGETLPARELELKLLAHGEQEHTETGAHAKVLETWKSCAARKRFRPPRRDPEKARAALEARLASWPKAALPWQERKHNR